jgi:hypothetical protein
MITAKLAKKPYLEISKSLYDEIAKTGRKTIKISIHHNGRNGKIAKARKPSLKKIQEFADKTLGMWADNPEIDKAFEELEEKWRQWDKEMLS